ncbi:MAG: TIGR00730 family Rossman fold protein [Candidatus Gastranaerophilales bacterium]|nr:TIGR00730 family Rossman fold protein [Candidatus Gastranaerophilales bacterium]
MKNNICVFASSSNYLDEIYYKDAKELGKLLGSNGYNIVYGGSTLGLMWTCAEEVQVNGGKVYGVMPQRLVDMGCRTDNCDEFFLAQGMRDRKAKMDEISNGVIALAGGFGTLEELSEMIVQKQLGYNKKPIVILNTNGFYDKLLEFFDVIIEEKFANKISRDLYYVAKTPQETIEYLKNYKEPDFTVSKHEIYSR